MEQMAAEHERRSRFPEQVLLFGKVIDLLGEPLLIDAAMVP